MAKKQSKSENKISDTNLTPKQIAFVEEYLVSRNATQAAIKAGYSPETARSIGSENLTKPDISIYIKKRLGELSATADEVITRLTSHSRASIELFLDEDNELDLAVARKNNALALAKKVKRTRRTEPRKDKEPVVVTTLEIELHDAQAATVQLGKVHGLFVEKTQNMNWENEIIELLKTGKLTQAQLSKELPHDAARLIIAAGLRPDDSAQAQAPSAIPADAGRG